MTPVEWIDEHLKQLPEPLLTEALDFILHDRLPIAQAVARDCTPVSADPVAAYDPVKTIWL